MSDGWIHDLVALMQQGANEQIQDMELNLEGRVTVYDPTTHMCKVLLDTRRAQDADDNDLPMETGWIKIGTGQVGNNSGDQYALQGGATAYNTAGEAVQVSIQNRASGLCAVANLTFAAMVPPGAGTNSSGGDTALTDPDGTAKLQPQERIIKFPNGSFVKYYSNGDMSLNATGNLVLNAIGTVYITGAHVKILSTE